MNLEFGSILSADVIDFLWDVRLEILKQTIEHLWLTLIALMFAVLVAIPLGIIISRYKRPRGPVLGFVNLMQTIPSLALLGFLIPLVGIGAVPAIIALFLYALLPIVRNTYTGIQQVDPAIKEAATGMGMTYSQRLIQVEMPIALPTIFAGLKTATVISIGVATLCALIGAGGLGEFIFRGISLNNVNMILAGAIPAAILALLLDATLGIAQKRIRGKKISAWIPVSVVIILVLLISGRPGSDSDKLKAGFPSEFIHREDGYAGLRKVYGLNLDVVEMEISLMYDAIRTGDVDVVSGFSTDGRIEAFDLEILVDDKSYFPPYHAAPLVRRATFNSYPELPDIFQLLEGRIDEKMMSSINFKVDNGELSPKQAASELLESLGFKTSKYSKGKADIVIGSKSFTESFILAEVFKILIENHSDITTEIKHGFGGTKLVFDALRNGSVDIYPEYTGTGLLVLLPEEQRDPSIRYEKAIVYDYVKKEFEKDYDLIWLAPLGFNNTHAIVMRRTDVEAYNLETISDLSTYLNSLRN